MKTILLFTIICIVLTANADLFAQDHEDVEQVGRIYNYWDYAHAVAVQGNYDYVATVVSGLQIMDVSNPEAPLMEPIIDVIEAYATVDEISDILRSEWGEYKRY